PARQSRAPSVRSPARSSGRRPRKRPRRSAPGRFWSSWKAAQKHSPSCNRPIRISVPARRFVSTRARTARHASPNSSSRFEQLLQFQEGRLPRGPLAIHVAALGELVHLNGDLRLAALLRVKPDLQSRAAVPGAAEIFVFGLRRHLELAFRQPL